jgi:hypothetical protein
METDIFDTDNIIECVRTNIERTDNREYWLTLSVGNAAYATTRSCLYSGEGDICRQLAYYFFPQLWSVLDIWNFDDMVSEPLPSGLKFFNSILPIEIANSIHCSSGPCFSWVQNGPKRRTIAGYFLRYAGSSPRAHSKLVLAFLDNISYSEVCRECVLFSKANVIFLF